MRHIVEPLKILWAIAIKLPILALWYGTMVAFIWLIAAIVWLAESLLKSF